MSLLSDAAGPATEADALPHEGDGGVPHLDVPPAMEQFMENVLALDVPNVAPVGDVPAPGPSANRFNPLHLKDRVAIMLLFYEAATLQQVERAWRRWQQRGRKQLLWRVVAEEPEVNRDRLFQVAAQTYAFEEVRLARDVMIRAVRGHRKSFSDAQWRRMTELALLPVGRESVDREGGAHAQDRAWIFATHDPSHPDVTAFLNGLGAGRYELRFASESLVAAVVAGAFPRRNEYLERVRHGEAPIDLGNVHGGEQQVVDEEVLEAEINRSNLINLFEATLVEAVRQGASDIHVLPNAARNVEIHFRVDGELSLWHEEERAHPEAFLAVVKDHCAGVDRFERDTAQDGALQRWIDDALIRFRVSILPIAGAAQDMRYESIVLRVLDDRKVVERIDDLGLAERAQHHLRWALRQPHGMVILTGPTGSGKSTTLFAALRAVTTPKRNAISVEDPVEYIIPGVRQVKLGHKLELDDALRSILRHDPDIVMVGEMRDRASADLAVKLANTGHLTFSTLHTNDAPSALARLYKLGVEPFLIAHAVNLIVAQRLVRTLCPACKRTAAPDADLLADLGFSEEDVAATTFYEADHAPECPTCGGVGYKGRQAITETMAFTPAIRRLIMRAGGDIDEDRLRDQAVADGMQTLLESARRLVHQGATSIDELMRTVAT